MKLVQKSVLKVHINCMKCKRGLLKTVTKLEGIDEVVIDSAKETMTVIGTVDPVVVVTKLRKSGKVAEVISVGPNKKEERKPDKPKPDNPKPDNPKPDPNFPSCCKQCEFVGFAFPYYHQSHDSCSIL